MEAASTRRPFDQFEWLRHGRDVIRQEGAALVDLAERLDDSFCEAIQLVLRCRGSVMVSGMGKAGLIGQKVTATLASTGTKSHFLHPGEAIHGDLGRVHADDVFLALSFSGETEEVTRLLPSLAEMRTPIIAITGRPRGTLAQAASVVLDLGPLREACGLGLAPSTSTTAMLAMGDALALVVSRIRGFAAEDFARFHPGGSLGRKLARVEDVMRPIEECRVASDASTVREVFVRASRPGRRTGAIMLVDEQGLLSGIFTDSDLARLLEKNRDADLDSAVGCLMTRRPASVTEGVPLPRAIELLGQRKISELPVVNDQGRPIGLIDITDIVGHEAIDAEAAGERDDPAPATVPFPNPFTSHVRR